MAYRWLYTHINEQFLHHVANFLFVCVLTTLYLQSNHNSVTSLSLAFNFSPWICIDSSPPFYRYIRVKDEPERWIIGIIYPCSLQSCAASADVTMLQQLDEFFQDKRERACLLYTAYLKEMRSCQQLKVRISFLGIINICSQYLIFFFLIFYSGIKALLQTQGTELLLTVAV